MTRRRPASLRWANTSSTATARSEASQSGLGGSYRSQRAVFSGITHGGGQAQYNGAGQLLVLYAPAEYLINGFLNYTWKSAGGREQYIQLNADNVLNNTKLYGLVYESPLSAKISYGIKF